MTDADANERAEPSALVGHSPSRSGGAVSETYGDRAGAAGRADPPSEKGGPDRYRLHRAGIHNVWQYDDHVFRFANGRLLLRGRNGAGKSKALEMLLPFLLDGDARRLDTTGTSRTSLRWLLLDGRTPVPDGSGANDGTDNTDDAGTGSATSTLGYLWVEFRRTLENDEPLWLTLGAAITASTRDDAQSVFFATDRRIGVDLNLVSEGRPMPIDRLRTEVGADNCYDTAVAYRARVMRELFGIDDPVRYRNLIHLLYRLRRPTIGERLEAGELVSVLAEALPPMDERVLDEMARNIADLEEARARLNALRTAKEQVASFLTDYRGYLHGTLRGRVRAVREQIEAYERRDAEVARLRDELDRLVTVESAVQEERDRLRRTRDTAASDAATLSAGSTAAVAVSAYEQQARQAAVAAYIRAAEASSAAARYALETEEHAKQQLADDLAAIDRELADLQRLHGRTLETARFAGISTTGFGQIPHPVPTTLAPRESATHVDIEGLEQAVEREPVSGIDLAELRDRLAELHDLFGKADEAAAERIETVTRLRERAAQRAAAERREAALQSEAEAADTALERAHEREQSAIEAVRAASADYAARVRAWSTMLHDTVPENDLATDLAGLEEHVELPLNDALRVLDADLPKELARRAHGLVDPLLQELRTRRDTVLNEQRELTAELEELSERKTATSGHIAAPQQPWAAAARDETTGVPFYLAVDFAQDLTAAERVGLEAALEASGVLSGWMSADGSVTSATTRDLLLTPGRPARGRTLQDVLIPVDNPGSGITHGAVSALLSSIALLPAPGEEEPEPKHRRDALPPDTSAVSLDGRWRLGVASGAHSKSTAEYIGKAARAETSDRHLANIDRRIAIAEALLAEADERCGDIERLHAELVDIARSVPDGSDLAAAWARLDNARSWLAETKREHDAARSAAETARGTALGLRAELAAPAARYGLPTGADELDDTRAALERLRSQVFAAHRGLEALAKTLEIYQRHVAEWERARSGRILAEDVRTTAINDMITVRREIELTDRARSAAPEQVQRAVSEVRGRMEGAAERLPELERRAQQARDDRVAAETRLDTAVFERAGQARRALTSGAALREMISAPDGRPDAALLRAAGLQQIADVAGLGDTEDKADGGQEDTLAERVRALALLVAALEEGLGPDTGTELDSSGILRRREELHRMLAASDTVGAWSELTEPAGIKRLTIHDDDGAHDITEYAEHLDQAIAQAEEAALLSEEEAFERHLLGELAGHLSRQIDEAHALISTMNDVLSDVTTSQGLGVRLDWRLAPDADEDVRAVVPLLARPAEQRTRVETTRLRDALRRCIEAIRRLDPTATSGAQLRAALDYRSWFAFTVYVTDAAHPDRERRLSHRTALSQGEQRVVAYLVLFAAAAAQFGSLAAQAPGAPRLILLDDAFAKVDEPTHGRLLGLLVELDLDFVLTSERVWGCFPSVPSLHIYECLRDPAVPGIATLHFTWDGNRRRLVGV